MDGEGEGSLVKGGELETLRSTGTEGLRAIVVPKGAIKTFILLGIKVNRPRAALDWSETGSDAQLEMPHIRGIRSRIIASETLNRTRIRSRIDQELLGRQIESIG